MRVQVNEFVPQNWEPDESREDRYYEGKLGCSHGNLARPRHLAWFNFPQTPPNSSGPLVPQEHYSCNVHGSEKPVLSLSLGWWAPRPEAEVTQCSVRRANLGQGDTTGSSGEPGLIWLCCSPCGFQHRKWECKQSLHKHPQVERLNATNLTHHHQLMECSNRGNCLWRSWRPWWCQSDVMRVVSAGRQQLECWKFNFCKSLPP